MQARVRRLRVLNLAVCGILTAFNAATWAGRRRAMTIVQTVLDLRHIAGGDDVDYVNPR